MRRCALAVAAALALPAAALPALASASAGNPNYRSIVTRVAPKAPGVTVDILNFDDRLEVTNRGSRPLVVYGYNDDPYVRILPDGTVQVNRRSPAAYLNSGRSEEGVKVPASADPSAPPQWKLIDRSGRYEWHDHRIHWMAAGLPPAVKDKKKRTKVFDWKVPVRVGATTGAIDGRLVWVGKDDGGAPVGAIVALVVLVVLGGGAVLLTRRRRGDADGDDGDAPGGAGRPGEAW